MFKPLCFVCGTMYLLHDLKLYFNTLLRLFFITRLELDYRTALTRGKVTRIYPLDLHVSEPLPDTRNNYDVIIASLPFTAMAKNKQEFKDVLKKVAAMLKPLGHLLIIDVIKGTFYTIGNAIFTNPSLSRDDTMEAVREAGLKITVWKEMTKEGYNINDNGTDIDDYYFACCRKM